MVWVTDEAHGDEGERMALEYLEYDAYERAPKRQFRDWDFWIERAGKKQYWEVKRDRRTHVTGNVVIEYQSNGQPSGISATRADFWMYIIDDEPTIFIIPVRKLRQMIRDRQFDSIRRIAEGGKNVAYFFNRSVLKDYEYTTQA